MRGVYEDLRFAIRLLRTNPGFALSSLLTLVLGILLNTATFGVVNALWFGKLPFRDDQQIVVVRTVNPGAGTSGVAWCDYAAASSQASGLAGAAVFSERTYNLSLPVPGAFADQVRGGMLSASALDMLGYTPVLGRGFSNEEQGGYDAAGNPPVVMISEGLWRQRLGADPAVIGRQLRLDGSPATIIGVLPSSFRFVYGGYQVIAPISRDVMRAPRHERSLEMIARLGPNARLDLANGQLEAVSASLNKRDAGTGALHAIPFREAVFGEAMRMYPILLSAALLLLLLVCANLANLLLAKTVLRGRELAIRLAIGASRGRLLRQVLTEGTLLALIGSSLALVLASWMRHLIVARVPELAVFAVDFRVVLYTLAIGSIAGVAFGFLPALHAARAAVSESLKCGGMATGPGGRSTRNAMMATQVAVAVVLLSGTGLLIRTVGNLRYVAKGLNLDGVVATTIQLKGVRYSNPAARLRFWETLLDRVSRAEGVEAVGVSTFVPLTNLPGDEEIDVEGIAQRAGGETMRIARNVAGGSYFRAIDLGLVAGRSFGPEDRASSPRVAIVNEAFARRFWPGDPNHALGRRIRAGSAAEWMTIVGMTSNARQFLPTPPSPEIIRPLAQSPEQASTLVIRAPGSSAAAVQTIVRRELRYLDADLPAGEFLTESAIVEMFYPKVMIAGLGILTFAAIGLAGLGLFGVIAFVVARQTHDLGIRIALGATGRSITAKVLHDGLRIVLTGVVVGMVGAIAVARLLRRFLFDVAAGDPVVFTAVPLIITSLALVAMLVPAIRASWIDPARVLRDE